MRLDVVVTLFVGVLAGYATARAIDAQGWRIQRRAAERLARAEVRRLRALLGPGSGAAGGDSALALLATAGSAPVRLHSAVERLLRRDVGLLSDAALVLLLQLDDALRTLERELDRVWQDSMAEAAAEAMQPTLVSAGAVVTRMEAGGDVTARLTPAGGTRTDLDGGAAGRASAARCLRAAHEVRTLLDGLEAATAPRPGWAARLRARLRLRARPQDDEAARGRQPALASR